MTIPTTNASFADLQTEYGGTNPIGMDEYRRGAGLVSYTETGVGTSQIEMASLRGLSSLTTNPRANNISSLSSFFNTTTYRQSNTLMATPDGINVVATSGVFDQTGTTIGFTTFYSSDAGSSWTQGSFVTFSNFQFSSMTYVPWAGVYVGTGSQGQQGSAQRARIYTSTNGASWTEKSNYPVFGLSFSGGNPSPTFYQVGNTLYAASYNGEISYTTSYSGGEFSWSTPVRVLPLDGANSRNFQQLMFDGTYWYGAAFKGMFKGTNVTSEWSAVPFAPTSSWYGIAYSASRGEYIAQVGSFFYRSTDGFASSSYTSVASGFSTGGGITWDPLTKIYAQVTNGSTRLNFSKDGITWTNAGSGYNLYFSQPIFKNGTVWASGQDRAGFGSGSWTWYFLRGPR